MENCDGGCETLIGIHERREEVVEDEDYFTYTVEEERPEKFMQQEQMCRPSIKGHNKI